MMGWEVKVKRARQKFWRHLETRSFCYCLFNSRFTALLVNLFLRYTVKLDEFWIHMFHRFVFWIDWFWYSGGISTGLSNRLGLHWRGDAADWNRLKPPVVATLAPFLLPVWAVEVICLWSQASEPQIFGHSLHVVYLNINFAYMTRFVSIFITATDSYLCKLACCFAVTRLQSLGGAGPELVMSMLCHEFNS